MYPIKIKRIYDAAGAEDGYRMLVDRLWPRGISKVRASLDEWNKAIAPSPELRKWFDHQPERFEAFSKQYRAELNQNQVQIDHILSIAQKQTVTLLYAAKSESINHAIVLLGFLNKQ